MQHSTEPGVRQYLTRALLGREQQTGPVSVRLVFVGSAVAAIKRAWEPLWSEL